MDSSRAGGDMFLIKSCVDRVVVEESDEEEKVKEQDEKVKEEEKEEKEEKVMVKEEEEEEEEETKDDKVTIDFEAPEWLINAALELNNQDVALTRTWLSEHAKMYILGKDLGDEEEKMTKLNDEDFDDAAVGVQAFEHLVLLNRYIHNKLTQVLHSFHSEDVESSLCESSSSENASSMSIEDDRDRTAGESHVFLTQTTLKYLPPRPSQQHRVFEWYVVFEREAREFQSFHTFIFQSH